VVKGPSIPCISLVGKPLGNCVIYWAHHNLYLFNGSNIYYMDTTSTQPGLFGASYLDAMYLVDSRESMGQHDLPLYLMHDVRLFTLQAASPNPIHKQWTRG